MLTDVLLVVVVLAVTFAAGVTLIGWWALDEKPSSGHDVRPLPKITEGAAACEPGPGLSPSTVRGLGDGTGVTSRTVPQWGTPPPASHVPNWGRLGR